LRGPAVLVRWGPAGAGMDHSSRESVLYYHTVGSSSGGC
jgi:hypothetical protein